MSIFEQQPKRKVHNYDEAETIFDSLHTFKKLAQAGYIELEPETLKMLDKL